MRPESCFFQVVSVAGTHIVQTLQLGNIPSPHASLLFLQPSFQHIHLLEHAHLSEMFLVHF